MINVPFRFGGTSLLIIVGVALDTFAQMQQHLLLRKYDGFMKKGRVRFRGRQQAGGFERPERVSRWARVETLNAGRWCDRRLLFEWFNDVPARARHDHRTPRTTWFRQRHAGRPTRRRVGGSQDRHGDVPRAAVREGTPMGLAAKAAMDRGDRVPG
ncbi:MAG: hypothetical protein U0163_06980 [Gemmatimonadaceae bacterium]